MAIKKIQTESFLMRFFKKIKLDSIAWSLRRLYCPVDKDALVLEVGSGANPYFRANVLCDAYEETQERYFAPLVRDRPIVLAFAERLPFKDDSFDFIIASHVLEHSTEPEKFFAEIQRVGKAGYIEVPDAFMERLTAYEFHRLEITDDKGVLLIKKKKNYIQDQEIRNLFICKAASIFPKWVARFPFQFHIRYYWSRDSGGIKYKIINPEYKFDWEFPQSKKTDHSSRSPIAAILKRWILSIIRWMFSQKNRNRSINLLSLFRCIQCHGEAFKFEGSRAFCIHCRASHYVYLPGQKEVFNY